MSDISNVSTWTQFKCGCTTYYNFLKEINKYKKSDKLTDEETSNLISNMLTKYVKCLGVTNEQELQVYHEDAKQKMLDVLKKYKHNQN